MRGDGYFTGLYLRASYMAVLLRHEQDIDSGSVKTFVRFLGHLGQARCLDSIEVSIPDLALALRLWMSRSAYERSWYHTSEVGTNGLSGEWRPLELTMKGEPHL